MLKREDIKKSLHALNRELAASGEILDRVTIIYVQPECRAVPAIVIEEGIRKMGFRLHPITTYVEDGVITRVYIVYNTRRLL